MEMWQAARRDAADPWSSVSFVVHSQGAFDVKYAYGLASADKQGRKRAWMQQHGIVLV